MLGIRLPKKRLYELYEFLKHLLIYQGIRLNSCTQLLITIKNNISVNNKLNTSKSNAFYHLIMLRNN